MRVGDDRSLILIFYCVYNTIFTTFCDNFIFNSINGVRSSLLPYFLYLIIILLTVLIGECSAFVLLLIV